MIKIENELDQGISLQRRGKFKEALDLYLNALTQSNNDASIYISIGDIYYILGDYQNSISSYLRVLKLDGNIDYNYLLHFGHALMDEEALVNINNNIDKYRLSGYLNNACNDIASFDLKPIITIYRCLIDPYFAKYIVKPSEKLTFIETVKFYDEICVNAAGQYINTHSCKSRLLKL